MSDEQPQRPATDDPAAWRAYWQAQGMPWRRTPEIDAERRAYLAERRAIEPDIEKGLYPFKDIKLSRADVEWLLATHEDGRGPVDWSDQQQRQRKGLDLRGADLRNMDLHSLPLARLRGGLSEAELFGTLLGGGLSEAELFGTFGTTPAEREAAAAQLQGASLSHAQLQGASLALAQIHNADLWMAQLQGASLLRAHLESVNLPLAQLQGADLRGAFCDTTTALNGVTLGDKQHGTVRVADVRWGGVNLAVVDWASIHMLGDEQVARQWKPASVSSRTEGKPSRAEREQARQLQGRVRLDDFRDAVRANRQLATALRDQGVNEDADRFAYRAQVCQLEVLRRQRQWGRWLLSWFLDLIAGYGYKPQRSLFAYLLAIFGFGIAYYFLGQAVGPHLSPLGAFVFSMTSFHGRGFFPGGIVLDDPITVLAAFEALVGLVIEVSFIATFTQRFFAR